MNQDDTQKQFGRYRIEGILGTGAMAVVYAGFDPEIERQVAIKCLHSEVATDLNYRRRFQIEARAAGHLNHPNIVTIFDTGETDEGRPYIAMERLSGDTLASRVSQEGYPSIEVIMELAGQMANALNYAHSQGVVHHDIKPENIMFVEGWKYAKISDFGIAERRDSRENTQANEKEIGGTPAFMPLERLLGDHADARSDLFSLGVVLFWLVTGKLPWSANGDVNTLVKERKTNPQPAIEPRDPSTPSILISIIRTLLAQQPDARYQSGSEVIDDLRLAQREHQRQNENPLVTRIISLRVRWASMLGAILTLVLLIGLTAIYSKQSTAVTGLALDYGSSLGRMIANESAENMLLGDRAATRALVEDISRNRQIHYLAVADRQGKVIASTLKSEVGQPQQDITTQHILSHTDNVDSYRGRIAGDASSKQMLLFNAPIRYQNKLVGDLRLGISNAPLDAAQQTTLWVIVTVLVVTLIAVVGAAYWLFRRPLGLLELLSDALLRVARGDYEHRIRLVRRDELGRLFNAFNMMNESLESRAEAPRTPLQAVNVEEVVQPTEILSMHTPTEREEE
jgi:serine/threonine protein kinase/HAMP domain-containing protein